MSLPSPSNIILCALIMAISAPNSAIAFTLSLRQVKTIQQPTPQTTMPHQLPHSRIAIGTGLISKAWFSHPTSRYGHGVLGDRLEATILHVTLKDGRHLSVGLPQDRVFEDLVPRLADVTGDETKEVLVVESELDAGASLAVYGVTQAGLSKLAASPHIGKAHRWLNPLGTGDFNGDGATEIAIVTTPHIGGILTLYAYAEPTLTRLTQHRGISTHNLYSTELGLGVIIPHSPRDLILAPTQSKMALQLLEWTLEGWMIRGETDLPSPIASSLISSGEHAWRFKVESGEMLEMVLE